MKPKGLTYEDNTQVKNTHLRIKVGRGASLKEEYIQLIRERIAQSTLKLSETEENLCSRIFERPI